MGIFNYHYPLYLITIVTSLRLCSAGTKIVTSLRLYSSVEQICKGLYRLLKIHSITKSIIGEIFKYSPNIMSDTEDTYN